MFGTRFVVKVIPDCLGTLQKKQTKEDKVISVNLVSQSTAMDWKIRRLIPIYQT